MSDLGALSLGDPARVGTFSLFLCWEGCGCLDDLSVGASGLASEFVRSGLLPLDLGTMHPGPLVARPEKTRVLVPSTIHSSWALGR